MPDQLLLLNPMGTAAVLRGDFATAASAIAEADAVCEATGSHVPLYAAMRLAAFRGREAEAAPLIQATLERAATAGQGGAVTSAHWAAAVLYNGLGRYADALAAAQQASGHRLVYTSVRGLPADRAPPDWPPVLASLADSRRDRPV